MGEFKHDLIVHLKDTFSIIAEVDPDRYCHMDMLNDICKCVIGDEHEGYMILVWYDIPGTNERLEITNDVDMVTMFNLHAGVVLIHLYVKFVSTNCKNLTPNVVCEASGSMVRIDDDVVYREEDDDTDYVQDSSDDSALSDDSDKLGSGVCSDEDNDEAGNGSDGNWSNYDSEDCDRELNDSDVENNHVEKGLYGKQYVPNENERVSLEKGMLFRDVYEFRAALRDYVIGEGVEIVRLKNEKSRVRAICADLSCNWYVFASPTADGITFQIKVYNSDHICVRSSKNTNATSTWIAQKLAKSLKADPNMSYESMGEALMENYGVEVDRSKLYRARKRGKGEDVGSHSNSYKKLAKYAQLVRQTNPGSYVKMQLDRLDITQNPTFKRFFVCFEAMRKGFVEGCRPFIGLDGCHLKGNFGGVLLAAVSLDENNGLFPVAYGVVECECKDSWGWFLTCLETIIGQRSSGVPYVIMSDKQKGLIEAIPDVMPECQVRHCTRHLYNNFRGKYSGLALRDNFWRAVKAYNLFLFEKAMQGLQKLSKEAFDWLDEKPKSQWARHAFDPRSVSPHITNNMTESFNSWVDDLRGKTILTLVEQVRLKLMEKLHERYTNGCNWETKVTLEAWEKIELAKKDSLFCKLIPAGDDEFQVIDGYTSFAINLRTKKCPCGVWEISGLPCKHAAKCITYKRADIQDYCDPFYSTSMYIRAYSQILHPMPDIDMLPKGELETGQDTVLPPKRKKLIGRPKKKRKREQGERAPGQQEARRSCTVRCTSCKEFGHNKRTCQGAAVGSAARSKGKKGQNSKNNVQEHQEGGSKVVEHRLETSRGDQRGTQSSQINIQASLTSDISSKEKRITHGAAR